MISDSDVNKIAKLSYLLLDPKESQALGKDLNSILGYIEQLQLSWSRKEHGGGDPAGVCVRSGRTVIG